MARTGKVASPGRPGWNWRAIPRWQGVSPPAPHCLLVQPRRPQYRRRRQHETRPSRRHARKSLPGRIPDNSCSTPDLPIRLGRDNPMQRKSWETQSAPGLADRPTSVDGTCPMRLHDRDRGCLLDSRVCELHCCRREHRGIATGVGAEASRPAHRPLRRAGRPSPSPRRIAARPRSSSRWLRRTRGCRRAGNGSG
jgi:hypothetical protein